MDDSSGEKLNSDKLNQVGKLLHDEIGPLLSAAGLRLQLLRMDFPDTADRVREVTETLDTALDHIRALAMELRPSPFSKPGKIENY